MQGWKPAACRRKIFYRLYTLASQTQSPPMEGVLHSKFVLHKFCRAPPPILNYFNHCCWSNNHIDQLVSFCTDEFSMTLVNLALVSDVGLFIQPWAFTVPLAVVFWSMTLDPTTAVRPHCWSSIITCLFVYTLNWTPQLRYCAKTPLLIKYYVSIRIYKLDPTTAVLRWDPTAHKV
jgi:hypothetical protein